MIILTKIKTLDRQTSQFGNLNNQMENIPAKLLNKTLALDILCILQL